MSSIGGSYVIQHWDVADDKFKSKAVLNSGELDVLTMAALYLPDEGIENFVQLAAEKSPHIRVLVQEFWLPFDVNVNFRKEKVSPPTREVYDGKKLQAEHDAYFAELDAHVRMLNEKYGDKPRVFVAQSAKRCSRCASRLPRGRCQADEAGATVHRLDWSRQAALASARGLCLLCPDLRSQPGRLARPGGAERHLQ